MPIASILSELVANKYLLGLLGALLAAGAVYYKGYNSAIKKKEADEALATSVAEQRLRHVEAENQLTEAKRAQDAETVNHADDVGVLIGLFDNLVNKTEGTKPPKKPE
jgi:hypothetical protein